MLCQKICLLSEIIRREKYFSISLLKRLGKIVFFLDEVSIFILFIQNIYTSGLGEQRLAATSQFSAALTQFRDDVNEYTAHMEMFMAEINEDLTSQLETTLERFKEKIFHYGEDSDDLNDWMIFFYNTTYSISQTRPFTISPSLVHPFYVQLGHVIGNMHMATSHEEECYSRMIFQERCILRKKRFV